MEDIKQLKEAQKKWQALQPLTEDEQARLSRKFTVDFNYNSNHIEGNTLTYGQTEILLLFGKVQQACSDRFSYILCHSLVSKYIVNIFLLFCRGVGALQLFDGGEVGGGVLSAAGQVGNVECGNRCVGCQAEAKIVEPGW